MIQQTLLGELQECPMVSETWRVTGARESHSCMCLRRGGILIVQMITEELKYGI